MLERLQTYLFKKKYTALNKEYFHLPPFEEFRQVMCTINGWLEFAEQDKSVKDIVHIIDYLIDVIKEDMRTSAATEMIFCTDIDKKRNWTRVNYPFTNCFQDVAPERISTYGKTLIASPADWGKLSKACNHIARRGFLTDMNNYTGQYYPELNMIIVENGLHHSCVAAQLNETGEIKAYTYPLSQCFHRIHTDGTYWYDKENPTWKSQVYDVRMAILFELANKKNTMRQRQDIPTRKESIQSILDAIEDDFHKTYAVSPQILSNILTPELAISIAKRSSIVIGENRSIVEIIPVKFHTEEFYRIAVSRNGIAIKDVPPEYYSESLCQIAVNQHGEALQYVPYHFLTLELCHEAVAEFGMALRFVPNSWIDFNMAKLALKTAPKVIEFVPDRLHHEELWIYIMARHPHIVDELLPKAVRAKIAVAREL